MINNIQNFIVRLFGGHSFWATFFISMIPVIELKGAVPFGMSSEIFGSNALPWYLAWLASAIGGLVPAFLLVWLFTPFMKWLKKTKLFCKVSEKIEQKYYNNAQKIENRGIDPKSKMLKQSIGLITFVAIPLPLTGVYTGSAIASFLSLGYVRSILSILIGNIISGGIVVLLCTIFAGYEMHIFGAFLILLAVILLCKIIASMVKRKRLSQKEVAKNNQK